jgi:rhamnosyltransferase
MNIDDERHSAAPISTVASPGTHVIAVVVAYSPDANALGQLLDRLGSQVSRILLVDNADTAQARQTISTLAQRGIGCPVELLRIGHNSGIGQAQNRGISRAIALGARWVLLSDDDSLPAADMVMCLVARMMERHASPLAAAGAWVVDDRTVGDALVFRDGVLGPRRMKPGVLHGPATKVAFLVASGCLIDVKAWQSIGPMREDLFIDHVDLEWCLRARRAGWSLAVVPAARLSHRLGDRLVRPWYLGYRPVHLHVPTRNYYLMRNTLLLLSGPLMSTGWRLGYLVWIAKYVLFHVLCVPPRLLRTRLIAKGLADGIRGISGRLDAGNRRPP